MHHFAWVSFVSKRHLLKDACQFWLMQAIRRLQWNNCFPTHMIVSFENNFILMKELEDFVSWWYRFSSFLSSYFCFFFLLIHEKKIIIQIFLLSARKSMCMFFYFCFLGQHNLCKYGCKHSLSSLSFYLHFAALLHHNFSKLSVGLWLKEVKRCWVYNYSLILLIWSLLCIAK